MNSLWVKDKYGFHAKHNPSIRADKNGGVYGGGVVSVNTFTSDTETVTRTKLNGLAANLVSEFNGSIEAANMKADTITNTVMGDNSIDSDQYVDNSIDNAHMADNSIDSDQYVDVSIDTVHLSADCITNAKIGDGEVDTEHLAADAINGTITTIVENIAGDEGTPAAGQIWLNTSA